jgi:hypothetical protein
LIVETGGRRRYVLCKNKHQCTHCQ